MITSLAINNYRSILSLIIPLGPLNVITGPNGTGKSNLYKALRLLADTAQGGVVNSLAREGGLSSTYWAGPEKISKRMKEGVVPVQGGPLQDVKRLRLGFATEEYGYSISLGLPTPSDSQFSLDPEIKRETIWAGGFYRPASSLVDRNGPAVKLRNGRGWDVVAQHLNSFDSLFDQVADPGVAPEVFHMRKLIRRWRFYDHFRRSLFVISLFSISFTAFSAYAKESQLGYISDDLTIFMHSGPGTNYRILGTINAGAQIQTTGNESNDYSEITDDKNRITWVETKYISQQPGLRFVVADLNGKLASNTDYSTKLDGELNEVKNTLNLLSKEKEKLQTEFKQVQQQLEQAESKVKDQDTNIKKQWFFNGAIVLGVGLILGLILPRFFARRRSSMDSWG